jgi:hypothetical protein
MSTRHFWKIFGRVNILHYCFSRQLGETSSHINIAENPEAKSPPLGNPQIFHRQTFDVTFNSAFTNPSPPEITTNQNQRFPHRQQDVHLRVNLNPNSAINPPTACNRLTSLDPHPRI